jgi:hypothetical protein
VRAQRWLGDLDDPVEDLAPPAAATGAVVLVGQLAHLPVLALVLPRALELVGMAYVLAAVNRYDTRPPSPAGTSPHFELADLITLNQHILSYSTSTSEHIEPAH